jgi:hypothetical protein
MRARQVDGAQAGSVLKESAESGMQRAACRSPGAAQSVRKLHNLTPTLAQRMGMGCHACTRNAHLCRPQARQDWRTFVRNHRHAIAAMDLFIVFSVAFRPVHGWFAIEHARNKTLHINSTEHTTAGASQSRRAPRMPTPTPDTAPFRHGSTRKNPR